MSKIGKKLTNTSKYKNGWDYRQNTINENRKLEHDQIKLFFGCSASQLFQGYRYNENLYW